MPKGTPRIKTKKIDTMPIIKEEPMQEKVIFAGSGVVWHGEKAMCEFNKQYYFETEDAHVIATLKKRGYKEIPNLELFLENPTYK